MKYLGSKGGWRNLAATCLKMAEKEADYSCVHSYVFTLLCDIADIDECEEIVKIKSAVVLKQKFGEKWYKVPKE